MRGPYARISFRVPQKMRMTPSLRDPQAIRRTAARKTVKVGGRFHSSQIKSNQGKGDHGRSALEAGRGGTGVLESEPAALRVLARSSSEGSQFLGKPAS